MARNTLQNFLQADGRLKQWPAKRANQELALAYLADKFRFNRTYSEPEVNDILRTWHTFDDWAILRRALIDGGYMQRNRDGSDYRRIK